MVSLTNSPLQGGRASYGGWPRNFPEGDGVPSRASGGPRRSVTPGDAWPSRHQVVLDETHADGKPLFAVEDVDGSVKIGVGGGGAAPSLLWSRSA